MASNSTVTQRSAGVALVAGALTALFSRRMPNTFSQAMRYSGTSENVKANATTEMPTSLPMPKVFDAGRVSVR